jgi:ubiquinone/menaquinone biosynthesis C-methylase UbiE
MEPRMHDDRSSSRSGSGSFGSGMTGIDAADDPQALLNFLDEAAEVPEISDAKRRATQALSLQPGDRVLEVGCGTGVDLPALVAAVRPGGRLVGIDMSELAIGQAAQRMASVPEAELLVADAHELPFAAGAFDGCRVDRTMLHLADPDRALRELRRVLAHGGRLVINESGSRLEGSRSVVATDVHHAVMERQSREHERVAHIRMFLPLLIPRAGFVDMRLDTHAADTDNFETADRLLRLRAGAEEAVKAGSISSDAAEKWLAGVQAAMEAGDVLLHSDTFLFTAKAPDDG